jgi:type I restriction enzyme S subunit
MSHYKPYPAYKDSGVDWIGPVPEHWEVVRMKRAASLRNERRNDSPEGWTYIGLEDVEPESGKYAPTEGASRQSEDSMVGVHRADDVLYGKLRPYLRKAIVADQDGLCSTEFLVLSPRRSTAPWLHRWLLTPEVTQQIEAGCDGAKMPRADWEYVGSIPIPLPPFAEQTAIATVIDRETARIDALIQKKTRFIELLKEKRQALITHAVTKGLDPNVKMKDSGVEWIGQVPEHWEVARIKRLASLRNERRNDAPTNTTYIGLEDVEAGSGRYRPTNGSSRQSENSTVGIFYDGDVLYGKLRPYLRKAIVSEMAGCCSTEFLILRAKKIEPKWLQEWLLTPDVTHQIESGCEGAKMPRADWWHIGSIEAVYPDQYEQAQILATLDRQTARIDALIGKAEQSITLLKERRSAFITAAVTGQIDLRGEQ